MSERPLPDGWAWAKFKDVARVASNLVDPAGHQDKPHIAPNHIESETGKLLEYTTVAADGMTSSKHLFKPGQILYSKIRPYLAKAAIVDFEGLCSADMYPIETELDPRYLLHWMLSSEFTAHAAGKQGRSVLPKINREALDELPVPVPPFDEQKRIAGRLDEALSLLDAGVADLRATSARVRMLRESVLSAAFGPHGLVGSPDAAQGQAVEVETDAERRALWANAVSKPYSAPAVAEGDIPVPAGWADLSLEAVTHPTRTVSYGILKPGENVPGGVPYVKVKHIKGGTIDLANLQRTTEEIASGYKRSTLQEGDVLISIRGTYGRVAVVPGELAGGNITQDSARLAPLSVVSSRFLFWFLQSKPVQNHLQKVARGVAVKGVNIGDLRKLRVPVPDRTTQELIVEQVERYMSVLDTAEVALQVSLRRAHALRRSTLNAAFEGRLVHQDLSDEPALALLERIKTSRPAVNGRAKKKSPKAKVPA